MGQMMELVGALPWNKMLPVIAMLELLELSACAPAENTVSAKVDWQTVHTTPVASISKPAAIGEIGWY